MKNDKKTAEWVNQNANEWDVYKDSKGSQWQLTTAPGKEYGIDNDIPLWENPAFERVEKLPEVLEPYEFMGNQAPSEEPAALPTLPFLEQKIEIYSNAVLIDGKRVRVRKDGVKINNYANGEELMTVTIELMPKEVSIYPHLYTESGRN